MFSVISGVVRVRNITQVRFSARIQRYLHFLLLLYIEARRCRFWTDFLVVHSVLRVCVCLSEKTHIFSLFGLINLIVYRLKREIVRYLDGSDNEIGNRVSRERWRWGERMFHMWILAKRRHSTASNHNHMGFGGSFLEPSDCCQVNKEFSNF